MMDNKGNEVLATGAVLDDGGLWAMNYYLDGVLGDLPN
jgi:basic membrane protein A